MKMALKGDTLLIKDADSVQFAVIKSWNKMRWDKKTQTLAGIADMELLDKLATMVNLTPPAEARRQELHAVTEAVDRERMAENPAAFVRYPVKLPLYKHQTRAANMALLTFGWVNTEGRPI